MRLNGLSAVTGLTGWWKLTLLTAPATRWQSSSNPKPWLHSIGLICFSDGNLDSGRCIFLRFLMVLTSPSPKSPICFPPNWNTGHVVNENEGPGAPSSFLLLLVRHLLLLAWHLLLVANLVRPGERGTRSNVGSSSRASRPPGRSWPRSGTVTRGRGTRLFSYESDHGSHRWRDHDSPRYVQTNTPIFSDQEARVSLASCCVTSWHWKQ